MQDDEIRNFGSELDEDEAAEDLEDDELDEEDDSFSSDEEEPI